MPRSTGVGRRHKCGSGNRKLTPQKRKISQANNDIGGRVSKEPKGSPAESSRSPTSSSRNISFLVTNRDFPTVATMTKQKPKINLTPPPPPTADSTTSLVVEFYKENLHTIVTSVRNPGKMQYRNKSATITTKNSATIPKKNSAMVTTGSTTTTTTNPSLSIFLQNEQQARNDIAKSIQNAWKMQYQNKSAMTTTKNRETRMMNTRHTTTTMTNNPSPPIILENDEQSQHDSRAEDLAKRNFTKIIAPKLNSLAFFTHRGANRSALAARKAKSRATATIIKAIVSRSDTIHQQALALRSACLHHSTLKLTKSAGLLPLHSVDETKR
jgi:hypothetical protein